MEKIEFNMTLPPINLWTTNRLRPKENKMNVKLYTSPTCGACPAIKERLDASGIKYTLCDVSDLKYRDELFSLGVRAVPYLIATNSHGSEYQALGTGINVTSLEVFLNA